MHSNNYYMPKIRNDMRTRTTCTYGGARGNAYGAGGKFKSIACRRNLLAMANFCRGDFSSFSETGGRPSSAKRQRTFSFPHPTTSPANTFQSQSRQNVQGQGQGVSQWGRNQLASLPGSNVKEGGGSGQRGMGGASQSETLQQCQKTTIKELSPHQANTVSLYKNSPIPVQ